MTGAIEDKGRFPGRIKFAGLGMYPKAFVVFGMLKSFISLFMMTPVSGTMSLLPKSRLTVVVREKKKGNNAFCKPRQTCVHHVGSRERKRREGTLQNKPEQGSTKYKSYCTYQLSRPPVCRDKAKKSAFDREPCHGSWEASLSSDATDQELPSGEAAGLINSHG